MPNAAWIEAVERWRKLPLEERRRRHLGSDPPSRRQFHGDGGRTGGRGMDSGTTRPPYSATRYAETSFGILSCREIVPYVGGTGNETEVTIFRRPVSYWKMQLCGNRIMIGTKISEAGPGQGQETSWPGTLAKRFSR